MSAGLLIMGHLPCGFWLETSRLLRNVTRLLRRGLFPVSSFFPRPKAIRIVDRQVQLI